MHLVIYISGLSLFSLDVVLKFTALWGALSRCPVECPQYGFIWCSYTLPGVIVFWKRTAQISGFFLCHITLVVRGILTATLVGLGFITGSRWVLPFPFSIVWKRISKSITPSLRSIYLHGFEFFCKKFYIFFPLYLLNVNILLRANFLSYYILYNMSTLKYYMMYQPGFPGNRTNKIQIYL